jgi:hypothetical protein
VVALPRCKGGARIHLALGIELSELADRGLELIGIGQDDGSVSDPSCHRWWGHHKQDGARLRATELGKAISELGRLADLVREEELEAITADLCS